MLDEPLSDRLAPLRDELGAGGDNEGDISARNRCTDFYG
jgi:hypothetical protein